jgi:dephospho-CoA kinase
METESVKGGKKYVIGVTGYTGCGKTFVCTLLKELLSESKVLNPFQPVVSINSSSKTCAILNADEMAKELRDHHEEVKQQIKSILGDEVYDQSGKSIPQKINEVLMNASNGFHNSLTLYR